MSTLHRLRAMARRMGIDVRRYPDSSQDVDLRVARLLNRHHFTLVLDVGASVGDYGASLRHHGYAGKIVSFEPLSKAFGTLRARAAESDNWRAVNVAVGDTEGHIEINVAENGVSSSLLPMLKTHERAAPGSRTSAVEWVSVTTLDQWASGENLSSERIFAKVDTQGYEAAVLDGAALLLGRVDAVQLEVSFVPLYQGSPSYLELFTRMDALDFHPVSVAPVFFDATSDQVLQADVVFLRRTLTHGDQATTVPRNRK